MGVLIIIMLVAVISSGMKVIAPWQMGIYMRLGRFIRVLPPGMNFVTPLINQVILMDMRDQVVDLLALGMTSRDRVRVDVVGKITIKVVEPTSAFFNTENYKRSVELEARMALSEEVSTLDEADLSGKWNDITISVKNRAAQKAREFGVFVRGVTLTRPNLK